MPASLGFLDKLANLNLHANKLTGTDHMLDPCTSCIYLLYSPMCIYRMLIEVEPGALGGPEIYEVRLSANRLTGKCINPVLLCYQLLYHRIETPLCAPTLREAFPSLQRGSRTAPIKAEAIYLEDNPIAPGLHIA